MTSPPTENLPEIVLPTLHCLRQLPVVKVFKSLGNSGFVGRLAPLPLMVIPAGVTGENQKDVPEAMPISIDIVKKIYIRQLPVHEESFRREIAFYRYCQRAGFPYVPSLIAVDEERRTLYISYCGGHPPNKARWQRAIRERLATLYRQTGLAYIKYNGNAPSTHVYSGNVCLLGKEIYLIDFGSRRWRLDVPARAQAWPETAALCKALKNGSGDLARSRVKALNIKRQRGWR